MPWGQHRAAPEGRSVHLCRGVWMSITNIGLQWLIVELARLLKVSFTSLFICSHDLNSQQWDHACSIRCKTWAIANPRNNSTFGRSIGRSLRNTNWRSPVALVIPAVPLETNLYQATLIDDLQNMHLAKAISGSSAHRLATSGRCVCMLEPMIATHPKRLAAPKLASRASSPSAARAPNTVTMLSLTVWTF